LLQQWKESVVVSIYENDDEPGSVNYCYQLHTKSYTVSFLKFNSILRWKCLRYSVQFSM